MKKHFDATLFYGGKLSVFRPAYNMIEWLCGRKLELAQGTMVVSSMDDNTVGPLGRGRTLLPQNGDYRIFVNNGVDINSLRDALSLHHIQTTVADVLGASVHQAHVDDHLIIGTMLLLRDMDDNRIDVSDLRDTYYVLHDYLTTSLTKKGEVEFAEHGLKVIMEDLAIIFHQLEYIIEVFVEGLTEIHSIDEVENTRRELILFLPVGVELV